jgi:hypothetical protein
MTTLAQLSACAGEALHGTERHNVDELYDAASPSAGGATGQLANTPASSCGAIPGWNNVGPGGNGGAGVFPNSGGLPNFDCGTTFTIETPLPADLARVRALTARVCVNDQCTSSDFSGVEPSPYPYTAASPLIANRELSNGGSLQVALSAWLDAGQVRFEPYGGSGLTVSAWVRPLAVVADGDVWKVDLVEPSGESFYHFEQSVYYMTYDSRSPLGGLCKNAIVRVTDGGSPGDAGVRPNGGSPSDAGALPETGY